jgi:hypothetical protein
VRIVADRRLMMQSTDDQRETMTWTKSVVMRALLLVVTYTVVGFVMGSVLWIVLIR